MLRIPITLLLLSGASVTAQSFTWLGANVLGPRSRSALAYDSARERVVMFGGAAADGTLVDETWETVGATWTLRGAKSGPAVRQGHAMVFDRARGRTVLFGGENASSFFDDTWEWDGVSWTQRTPANRPPALSRHAMAYDSVRSRVVLFGGNATWEWDGTNWLHHTPSTSPPARIDHALAYDAARQRTVLFGGFAGGELADTWEWDGTNWLQRAPAQSPSPRTTHGMTFDTIRQRVVVFGGYDSGLWLGDTWEWDGTIWTARATTGPAPRSYAGTTYDSVRQRVVVCSGRDGYQAFGDTWEWNGIAWANTLAQAGPSARTGSAIVHDAGRGRAVLFGGLGGSLLGDTWEWDGATWTQHATPTGLGIRYAHAMAHDLARQRTVLFGGATAAPPYTLNDTWLWDGSRWSLGLPAISPGARDSHAMSYDSARQRTVLFGGRIGATTFADTWEWDGTNWTKANPAQSPPPRFWHAMAYDAARQRTVLFGGSASATGQSFADTWEWDGASWSQRSTGAGQLGLASAAMAFDPAQGRVVRFGGTTLSSQVPRGDVAAWDGTSWTPIATAGASVALSGHAMTHDAARRHFLVFGGVTGTGISADPWMLGALTQATATSFGTACGGSAGLPQLTSSLPRLGAPAFVLDLVSARASANCAFALASATQNLPIGGGCTLYLSGALVTLPVLSNAAGFASVDFPLPLDPRLLGGVCHAQAFVADPQGPVLGLACSAGRTVVVGD